MGWRWSRRAAGSLGWAALALGLALPLGAGAQAPVPVGAQFQVNSYTTGTQYFPRVAADADGDFVVVWESHGSAGTDTSNTSIQGQRYASNGTAQGAQFQVNTYTTGYQLTASVGAAPSGDFVVVWESGGSSGTDQSSFSVQGQRYASNGTAQGGEFQINTYTTNHQINPRVAVAADGDFVAVWESYGSPGTDTDDLSIQGQRFASNGTAQGAQFQVNTYTLYDQWGSAVAIDADGDFVVAWESYESPGDDVGTDSVQARRYSSGGAALGDQFQVNSFTVGYQKYPSLAAAADGGFAVVWMSPGSSGTDTSAWSIQGQRYASDGSPAGGEFQVNTYTTAYQTYPSAAGAPDGRFTVVWMSNGSFGSDTSGFSIQGQRYAVSVGVPSVSPPAAAAGALLLLLACAFALRRRV
jgi:hypothetical protein